MKKKILIVLLLLITPLLVKGVEISIDELRSLANEPQLGLFSDTFLSIQLADSPSSGQCLSTDGTDNVWGSCGGGGGAWAKVWTGAIKPTTSGAGIFVTASSTIQGSLRVDGDATTTGSFHATDLHISNNIEVLANIDATGSVVANDFTGDWTGTAISNAYGGTGANSQAWTGWVRADSGTWSVSNVSVTSTMLANDDFGHISCSGTDASCIIDSAVVSVVELSSSDFGDFTCDGTNCLLDAGVSNWDMAWAGTIKPSSTNDATGIYVQSSSTIDILRVADSLNASTTNIDTLVVNTGSTFPANDITDDEINEGLTFEWTAAHSWSTDARVNGVLHATSTDFDELLVYGDSNLQAATTTNLAVSGMIAASCDVKAVESTGTFYCGTDATGTGIPFAWTDTTYGMSTSTILGFTAGFLSNASSTVIGDFKVDGFLRATTGLDFWLNASSTILTEADFAGEWNTLHNASTTYPGFATQFAVAHNATTTYPGFDAQWLVAENASSTTFSSVDNASYWTANFGTEWLTVENASSTTFSTVDNTTFWNNTTTWSGFQSEWNDKTNASSTLLTEADFAGEWLSAENASSTTFSTKDNTSYWTANFTTQWNTLHNATSTYPGFQTQWNAAVNASSTIITQADMDTDIATHAGDDDAHHALVTITGEDYASLSTQQITFSNVDAANVDLTDAYSWSGIHAFSADARITGVLHATSTDFDELLVYGNATTTASMDALEFCINGASCITSWPSSSGAPFAWTDTTYGMATSTIIGFSAGALSNASTTITVLHSDMINATTTNIDTLVVYTGITVPANSISDDEINEGDTFEWTALHTFTPEAIFTAGLKTGGSINATTTNIDTLTVYTAITFPDPANCAAGSYPLGIDANGAVESCTDATTEIDSAILTHNDPDFHRPTTSLDYWFTNTGGIDTDGLGEGSSNLYYTQARVWIDVWASSTLDTILTDSQLHVADNTQAHTDYLLNSGSDIMGGTLTADGLTLGANENITLGSQTLDHDGTDFAFNDSVNITGAATTSASVDAAEFCISGASCIASWPSGSGLTDINSSQLGQLSDVNTTTLAVASALMWDGSEWISYATTTMIMVNEIDTEGELESVSNITNILRETEIDASSELLNIMDDETGTGVLVFGTSPTFTTGITVPANSISDDELNEGDTFEWTAVHSWSSDARITGVLHATSTDFDELLVYGNATTTGSMDAAAYCIAGANCVTSIASDEVGTKTSGDLCINDGSVVNCTVNTIAELETALDAENIITNDEMDASSELLDIFDDETGTGVIVFGTSPTFTTGITVPANSISDDELDEGAAFDWTAIHSWSSDARINGVLHATSTDFDNLLVYGDATFIDATSTGSLVVVDLTASGDIILPNDSILDAMIDWGNLTDLAAGGEVTWGNITAGELANDSVINADIDDDGAFVFTGAWGFDGGSLEIPQDDTVNAAGEIKLDTTSDTFRAYGASERVFDWEQSFSFTIASTTFDIFKQIPIKAHKKAITITDIACRVITATDQDIFISDGTNDTETIVCTTSNSEDDGSITNGTFTAREMMYVEIGTKAGTPDWLNVTISYTLDAD